MKRPIRFGVMLPVPAAPVDKLLSIAKANEEAGFDSIWIPDHLLFVPPGITPDAWSVLSALAVLTKKVFLGTAVSDPHRRDPAVLAQTVATVDRLSGGRVLLGLGAGEAMNLDPFGIRWDKPVSRLVEAIEIMRKLWSGEKVDYEGRFWRLKGAFLQVRPVGRIPIYLGAHGPKMLELTGRMADGWLPTPLTPELYRRRLKVIEESAKKAGRSLDEIDTAIYLYTCISDKEEEVRERLERYKGLIAHSPELLKEAGYDVEVPEGFKHYFRILPKDEDLKAFMEFSSSVPLEAALDFSISGTPEECLEKVRAYVEAGVRHFILVNVGPDVKYVIRVYKERIMPYFREG